MPVNNNNKPAAKPAATAAKAAAKPAANAAKPAAAAAKTAAANPVKAVNNAVNAAEKAAANAANAAGKAVKNAVAALTPAALAKEAEDGKEAAANTRNEMFKKICALIPNQISNATVVNAFELMRKEQKLLKKDFSAHLKANAEAFKKHEETLKKNKGYVEDQNNYKDMAYGVSTMQYSGCEIFATFNAMFNINGKHVNPLSNLISEFEKDGMVLAGKFGTAPKAIADYLTKAGYKTKLVTEEKDFDQVGKDYQSMILTMYNDGDDISQEVHTVNISKENNQFTAHNVYCNGKVVGPYASITETIKHINGGKAKGISLIGVKK